MPRQRVRVWWSRHVSWAPSVATALAVALLAVFPAPLIPVAHAYYDLCARYPVLAILTRHLPSLPLALLVSLGALALGGGGAAGVGRLIGTCRFNRRLERGARPLPARLARVGESLDLRGRLICLDDPRLAAFCFGFLRPRVAVTTGLLARLDDEELAAVLAHERHHLHRRDPARSVAVHALTAAAFMFPVAPAVRQRLEARSELAADRAALAVAPRGALAGALLTVLAGGEAPVVGAARLSATEARIAHLTGNPTLPAIPIKAAAVSLGVLFVIATATVGLTVPAEVIAMVCRFCQGVT